MPQPLLPMAGSRISLKCSDMAVMACGARNRSSKALSHGSPAGLFAAPSLGTMVEFT